MYDRSCEALAQDFIDDTVEHDLDGIQLSAPVRAKALKDLAQTIQDAIESWLEDWTRQTRDNARRGVRGVNVAR